MASNSPSVDNNTLLTKAAQVGKPQVIENAWKIANLTKPVKQRILDDFYRGLALKTIQQNLYDRRGADRCPPSNVILAVIRANSRPERIL